jgi:hypothetical protein
MDTDQLRTTTVTASSDPTIGQVQEFREILNVLSGGIDALHDDEQRITSTIN